MWCASVSTPQGSGSWTKLTTLPSLFWTDVVVDARLSVLLSHWGSTGRSPGSGDCAAAPCAAASAASSAAPAASADARRLRAPAMRYLRFVVFDPARLPRRDGP